MTPKVKKRRLGRQLATTGVATVAALLIGELLVRLLLDVPATPFLREWDPDLGVRYKKNLSTKITRPEFSVTFSTNSRGFREPEPPPPLDGSVLFIGDSYTEGWGVNDGEDYPSLVRQELDERYGSGSIPVVNTFQEALGVESLLLGLGLPDDNTHSPNERFRLKDFYRGIVTMGAFLDEFGTSDAATR